MKKHDVIIEDGVIAGNLYDKYNSNNPIARYLIGGFLKAFDELLSIADVSNIHEVGCGEGHLCVRMAKMNKEIRGSDFSGRVIEKARGFTEAMGIKINYKVADIHTLVPEEDAAELIVCCEVLEHLVDPEKAMNKLHELANPYIIISVPREPLWRMLNMLRGKYISYLGNTPGHIQHWSSKAFLDMVKDKFDVIKVLTPLPWVMVLCQKRDK